MPPSDTLLAFLKLCDPGSYELMLLGRALCLRGKSCRLWVSSELSNPAGSFWASAHSLAMEPKLTQRSQWHLFAKLWILSSDMLITANTIVYIMWFKKKKMFPNSLTGPIQKNYRSWKISTGCWSPKQQTTLWPTLRRLPAEMPPVPQSPSTDKSAETSESRHDMGARTAVVFTPRLST